MHPPSTMQGLSEDADIDEQAPCLVGDETSPREREIVRLVALGHPNEAIAGRLAISEATVETHLVNVFRKVGVHSRRELIGYALRVGIVNAKPPK